MVDEFIGNDQPAVVYRTYVVAAGFFYGSVVPERLGNCYGEVTWNSILVLLGS